VSVMVIARCGQTMDDAFRRDQNVLAGRYNNVNVNYWMPNNPSNTDPRPNLDQERPENNNAMGFEDGSFVRIRSISVSYTLRGARLGSLFHANSLRIYATAQDPFLFTRFQGLDPESATNAGTPSYSTLMMGVTVGL